MSLSQTLPEKIKSLWQYILKVSASRYLVIYYCDNIPGHYCHNESFAIGIGILATDQTHPPINYKPLLKGVNPVSKPQVGTSLLC